MFMKRLLLSLLCLFTLSCQDLPEEFMRAPNRALVKGDPKNVARIYFRSINGSLPLHVFNSKLAKEVWLAPGEYAMILDCFWPIEMQKPGGRQKLALTVEEGYDYYIVAYDTGDGVDIKAVPVLKD